MSGSTTPGSPKKKVNHAHGIYGHIGEAALRTTLKTINVDVTGSLLACEGCALAKAKAKGVSKLTSTVATAGERLYADISGPYKKSVIGNNYWCLFVDQYSGKSWSFFVNTKTRLPELPMNSSPPYKGHPTPLSTYVATMLEKTSRALQKFVKNMGLSLK